MAPSATEGTAVIQAALRKLDLSKHQVASNVRVMGEKWTGGEPGAAAVYQTVDKKQIMAVINPLRISPGCESTLIYSKGMERDVKRAIEEAKQDWKSGKSH